MSGTSTSGESEATATKRKDKFGKLEDDLFENFGGMSLMIYLANQPDGQVLIERSPHLAKKLAAAAKVNPWLYKVLRKYLDGSVYSALFVEMGTIVQAILKNHGIDPLERIKNRFQPAQPEDTSAKGFVPGLAGRIPA